MVRTSPSLDCAPNASETSVGLRASGSHSLVVPVQTAGFPYLNHLADLRRLHRPGLRAVHLQGLVGPRVVVQAHDETPMVPKLSFRTGGTPGTEERARVVRSKAKRSEAVLHVTIERDGRTQLLELPEWMADSAACASMVLADEPVASIDALRSLRDLLRVVGSVMVVEGQHLGVESQGDADEKTPSSPVCSAEFLSSPVGPAAVADSSMGSQAAGARTGGSAAEGASPRTPGEARRKGRVR